MACFTGGTGIFKTLHALAGPLTEVLGATAAEPARLLVIDGAESVLDGRRQLLSEIATAALKSGIGVAAVTRTDGKAGVVEALLRAATSAGTSGEVREQEVQRLTREETGELTATFTSRPNASTLAADPWNAPHDAVRRPALFSCTAQAGRASI
jgi:hypothetical protein